MVRKEQIVASIKEAGLVAVVRAENSAQAFKIADACIEGKVAAIEITFTVPGAQDVIKDLAYKADFLDSFRNTNDYNFMTEEQMAKSFLLALKSRVDISYNPVLKLFYNLQNRLRTKKHFEISLKAVNNMDAGFYGEYAGVLGVKFETGEKFSGCKFSTDSDIYMRRGNGLYLGVGGRVKVYADYSDDGPHIERVNVPVNINKAKDGFDIDILGEGLLQIKFYAPGGMEYQGEGWEMESDGDCYILTRFGDRTKLNVKLK
jgi:hypothetical protein